MALGLGVLGTRLTDAGGGGVNWPGGCFAVLQNKGFRVDIGFQV